MRLLTDHPRLLAMSMAGATVPQIVDECAPLREYPPSKPHQWEQGMRRRHLAVGIVRIWEKSNRLTRGIER